MTTTTTTKFILCPKEELNVRTVLLNGQSFRWTDHESHIVGVALNRIWKVWREDDSRIGFQVLGRFPRCNSENDEEDLRDYFQLDVNLAELYTKWKSMDSFFSSIFETDSEKRCFEGVRILKQPLFDTIFAFICSANNNITRISNMVNTLAVLYGDKMNIEFEEEGKKFSKEFYDFPSLEQLAKNLDSMETTLRKKGFGYRSKYIYQTAGKINAIEGGFENFEKQVKLMEYYEARTEIQKFDGIGPKVADCICLMALGHHHVVPVDTHVFQITANHYLKDLKKNKTVTDVIYKRIGDFYTEKFGSHAGWAHTVLFSTRLKRFKENSDDIVKKKKK